MVFFDPRTVELDPEIRVLPPGEYFVSIEKAQEKQNQNGLGCAVAFKVLTPSVYDKTLLFNYFNIDHYNEKAKNIGRQELKRLCIAIGMGETPINHPSDLCYKRLKVQVDTEPDYRDPNKTVNKIKKYVELTLEEQESLKKSVYGDIQF